MTEQVSTAKIATIVGRHLCTGPNVHIFINQNNNNNIILQYLKEFIAGIAGIDGTY